jgi:hypothetical protein
MVREVLFSLGCAALADWIQKLLTLAHARNRNQGAQAIADHRQERQPLAGAAHRSASVNDHATRARSEKTF